MCITVSGIWMIVSAGVAWGFLAPSGWLIPIALLMGGSVVGISSQFTTIRWKAAIITIGMPTAYLAVTHLTQATVVIEIIVMITIAFLLFGKRSGGPHDPESVRKIEEQMKQCC